MRMVVDNSYSNGTVTYTNLNTITTGSNDQLYFTRKGNNAPLSELLASVDKVCEFNNDVSYWGRGAESKYLKNGNAGSVGRVSYTCSGGGDATFEQMVSNNIPLK